MVSQLQYLKTNSIFATIIYIPVKSSGILLSHHTEVCIVASWITRMLGQILTLAFVPSAWRMPCYAVLGVMVGLGLLAFRVSEAHSYLGEDSRTCINCHIMVPEYATWQRGSHRSVTVCNDCHVPHNSIIRKYAFKAKDGSRHSAMFALRLEPQVIRAHPASVGVIQENCQRCHGLLVSNIPSLQPGQRNCNDCHRSVPHGDVHSLASAPNVSAPKLPSILTNPFKHRD